MEDKNSWGYIMFVTFVGWILCVVIPPSIAVYNNTLLVPESLLWIVSSVCSGLFAYSLFVVLKQTERAKALSWIVFAILFVGFFLIRNGTYGQRITDAAATATTASVYEEATKTANVSPPEKGLSDYYSYLQQGIDDGNLLVAWTHLTQEFQQRNFIGEIERYEQSWANTYSVSIDIDSNATILGKTTAEVHAVYTVKTYSGTGINPYIYCMRYEDNIWKIDWVNETVHCELD